MQYQLFTSESVCAGHPDKLCDQISDAILDACMAKDPNSRTAVECLAASNRLVIAGEITTKAKVDYEQIARAEIRRLGYTNPGWGFSDQSPIDVRLGTQSPEIAQGVEPGGAGDQGLMFGYACRETPELMPLPITIAHHLTRVLDESKARVLPFLRPDGKAQVTVRYDHGRPVEITHVTIAVPHDERISLESVKRDIKRVVIDPVLIEYGFYIGDTRLTVNGTGAWHLPGPASDAGLTGRKIVVDTYGGYGRVGGGAFSGKDPTKADRSGAYAARYIAKNIVASGLADRAEVALAYVIGAPAPVMQEIDTFGTHQVARDEIKRFAASLIDTSVQGIIETLNLKRPIYKDTATYGHFGDADRPWENVLARTSSATI